MGELWSDSLNGFYSDESEYGFSSEKKSTRCDCRLFYYLNLHRIDLKREDLYRVGICLSCRKD